MYKLYTQKGHFIVKLESEIEQLKEGRNANNEVYSEKFIQDMVKHAKFTLQVFGKQANTECDNQVQLCENYPQVTIPSILLRDMDQVLLEGVKPGSFVFRKLIGVILSDVNVWAESKGAKEMLRDYESEIGAAFEFVSKKRESFLMKECKAVINQMCAEARRSRRRGKEHDNTSNDATILLSDECSNGNGQDLNKSIMDSAKSSKRKVEDGNFGDNDNDSENEAAARDWHESCAIKRSIFHDKNYDSFSLADLEMEE